MVILRILGCVLGIICIIFWVLTHIASKKLYYEYTEKLKMLKILIRWHKNTINGYTMERYFTVNGIHSIAIYGYTEMSELLLYELNGTAIRVPVIIDDKFKGLFNMLPDCVFISVDEFEGRKDVDMVVFSQEKDYLDKKELIQTNYSGIVTSIERLIGINAGTD